MTALDLWIVAGYVLASLVVGVALARRASGSLEDFFVGGRALPWWLAGTSMAATTFSIDTPLYVAGVVGTRGIAGNWEWWSFGIAHIVLLYIFARLWRRAEVVTDNELSELRYGGRPAALLRGVKGFLFAGVLGPISMGLAMLAMVKVIDALEVLPALGLTGGQDRLWAVVGVSVLVLVYAGVSGLWGVVVTDFVQFVLGMLGAVIVAWVAVDHLDGIGNLIATVGAREGVDLLAFIPLTWGEGGRIAWSAAAGISASTFFAYVGLQWWAFRRSDGGGEFVQRLAGARDEREAEKAAWLFNVLHYVVRTWPWIIVALAAVVIYPDLADPELGYPRLMLDFLPAGVLGLVVASLVAAFMSTVSTTINWSASYLTHDLYVRFLRPAASSREQVVAARVASVVVTALGAAAAFYSEHVTTLFRLIIAVGTGPGLVLILRWFWWRVNAWAELAAMVAGFLVGLGTSVVPLLTIDDFGLRLLVTAGVTTAIWLPVMWLTAPESEERLEMFYRKVRPAGPGWARQRASTGVMPDTSLAHDLLRVAAGIAVLFGAMFGVGGLVLLRPGVAIGSGIAVVVGIAVLRWARHDRKRAAGVGVAVVALALGGAGALPAQVVEVDEAADPGVPLSRFLSGRFPGLQLHRSSGSPGSAPRMRIRGPGSLSLSNEPVVVLDGHRIDAGPRSTTLDIGGQAPSRLDDIPLASLARVEVIRGPEAAARWGAGAANGVILLTSRSPDAGQEGEVRAWSAIGQVRDVADRPLNWFGRDGPGACFAWEAADGRCIQSELQRFGPLQTAPARPFRPRTTGEVGADARLDLAGVGLEVGGSWMRDPGVLAVPEFESDAPPAPAGEDRRAVRLGLTGALGTAGRLRVGLVALQRRLDRVVDGNDFAGLHATGLLGYAEGGSEQRWGYRLFTPGQVFAREISQEVDRRIASATLAGGRGALSWTVGVGHEGIDRADRGHLPAGVILLGPRLPRGVSDRNDTRIARWSGRAALTWAWSAGELRGGTTLAADLHRSTFRRTGIAGVGLASGVRDPEEASEVTRLDLDGRRAIGGVSLVQRLRWDEALEVRTGVRGEWNTALGHTFDPTPLPFVAVEVWPARGGPAAGWWPRQLSLRGGWGRGVVVAEHDGRDLDRVVLEEGGRAPLETSDHWEAGAALTGWDGRVHLDLVRYSRTTRDLLLRTPLLFEQAALGASHARVGRVVNRGWEAALALVPLRTPGWVWSVDVAAAFPRNRVTQLTGPEAIRQGVQWTREGHPLGAYFDRPLHWEDRNGDGVLLPSEVSVREEAVRLGTPHPTREIAVATRVVAGPVDVGMRLLHRGGHHLRNLTEGYRCQVTLCRGFNDPAAPLAEQARALPAAIFPPDLTTEAGFIEPADFWRLAEVHATLRLPRAWPGAPRLTLVGHDVALWTDYSGMDPEVNQFGGSELLVRDFMTQPPVRRWSLRVDVTAPGW